MPPPPECLLSTQDWFCLCAVGNWSQIEIYIYIPVFPGQFIEEDALSLMLVFSALVKNQSPVDGLVYL